MFRITTPAQLKNLARNLRARRQKMKMPRQALAEKVGISYPQLAHIENARNWPSMPVYLSLLRALGYKQKPILL